MKKNIILSFHPDYFRPLLYGLKKYEYRHSFCKEPVRAFLYLTKPVSEFIGIVELGKALHPQDLKAFYVENHEIMNRMDRCIENKERAIIPIESFQLFKEPISITKIKDMEFDFSVPRSFAYIDGKDILSFLESRETYVEEFCHQHDGIYEDNIGVMCSEMEKQEEFIRLDKKFLSTEKAHLIKSSYVTK